MATRFALALVLLAGILISSQLAAAQEKETKQQTEEEPEFALTFSDVTASQDGEATLPVFFTRRPGAPNVAEMRVRLTYPNSILKYKNFEVADPARRASLESKVQEGEAIGGQVALEMAFALPDPAQNNFPSGQLATVNFRIADPAPGVSVTLKAELWIDGKPATGEKSLARVEEAHIEVPPIRVFINCFFFTH